MGSCRGWSRGVWPSAGAKGSRASTPTCAARSPGSGNTSVGRGDPPDPPPKITEISALH
ncbi:hypothetical protein CIB84_017591 [Bambusicola thoracicus]|uniref:Uncharacterized protein n=1 Tax=Bambusicola thoracicus TaxID=9083 RepID=A0A2P4S3F0_BAMTH|nr:hypothetical protein CIB84_017591 [Bambusicola thoracicus]